MAEKYGEVPKLFTKKWWEYFWDYYKVHTIVVVCALLAVLITVHQVSNRESQDIKVIFGSYFHISEQMQADLELDLEERIADVDGDGEKNLLFVNNGFTDSIEQAEYNSVLEARLLLSLEEDNSFIYIVDKKAAPLLLDIDYCDEMYLNAEDLGVGGADGLKGQNGICYGIPLKDSSILKKHNIKSDDLYLVLRKNFKDDELTKKAFDCSQNLAKELIK